MFVCGYIYIYKMRIPSNYIVKNRQVPAGFLEVEKSLSFPLCFGVEFKRTIIVLQRSKEKFSANIATIWSKSLEENM